MPVVEALQALLGRERGHLPVPADALVLALDQLVFGKPIREAEIGHLIGFSLGQQVGQFVGGRAQAQAAVSAHSLLKLAHGSPPGHWSGQYGGKHSDPELAWVLAAVTAAVPAPSLLRLLPHNFAAGWRACRAALPET